LIGGDGGTEREGAGAHEGNNADSSTPRCSEREREEIALGLAPTGGTRLSDKGDARARAWARLNGPAWAEMAVSIFLEFLLPFLFIFSRVFNSISIQVSNSNQIKYVQQFKEYLGSI
jgi:hypothetical protein